MNTATWLGSVLIAAGILALLGYGVYLSIDGFFASPDVTIVVKVAVPAVIGGLAVLLGVVTLQRFQSRKRETFRRQEY